MQLTRPGLAAGAVIVLTALLVSSCGPKDRALSPKTMTWGELRTIRSGVEVQQPGEAKRAPYPRERLVDGEKITVADGGLAWLRRDGGARLLVAGPAQIEMQRDAVAVREGKVFVDTPPGITTELITERGPLHLSHVRASLSASKEGEVRAYVLSGEVRTEGAEAARPGEELVLTKEGAKSLPVLAWEDWTGGLATTDRGASPTPFGVGTIGARLPGEAGKPRWPLAIHKLDVRVTIDADLAITEVDQTFFNPTSSTVEGMFRFRTPPSAMLHRFGVDRENDIVWGYVKEKEQAAAQYASHVYAGSREDPALLEWDAPGVYRARLYPIAPGGSRRVVTRYAEWLPRSGPRGERRLYVYPMAAEGSEESLPHIEELTITIDLGRAVARDVRTGMDGVREGDEIIVREHDYVPRADLAVELFDEGQTGLRGFRSAHIPDMDVIAPDARGEAERAAKNEADYVLVPLRATKATQPEGGLDLAIVVDSSAATDTSSMAIARAATKAILAHLGSADRVAVWAGDVSLRPVIKGSDKLLAADPARSRELMRGLARVERGGATDLGAILAEAASKLDPAKRGAVIYVGDGKPTVGELSLADLRTRLERLPRPVRIFTFGIGDEANMGILAGVAHGAFSARITDANEASQAALRLLEEAERPTWLGVTASLGTGVERVYPRELGALPADESVMLVGRVSGDLPKEVAIEGPGGSSTSALTVMNMKDSGDLMRRWAEGRLVELLDTGAGRAAVVEVGMRYGILTPFSSLYVPTTDEARRLNLLGNANRRKPTDSSSSRGKAKKGDRSRLLRFFRDSEEERETEQISEDNADNKEGGTGTRAKGEEGSMGNPNARDTNKRYGVAGPKDNPDPHIARSAALREAAEFGMIGLLNTGAGGDADAPSAPMAQPVEAAPPTGGGLRARGPAKQNAAALPPAAAASAAPAPEVDEVLADSTTAKATAEDAKKADKDAADDGSADIPKVPVAGKGGEAKDSFKNENKLDVSKHVAQNAWGEPSDGDLGGQRGPSFTTTLEARVNPGKQKGVADVGHRPVLCAAGANVPLEERAALWRERLAGVAGNVYGVLAVYDRALAMCEAPTWRERSRLLSLMVNAMGTVPLRVALWRAVANRPGVGDAVYGMILVRIRNATEMRQLHDALGIRTIEPDALAAALKNAKTPAERVVKLRELVAQWPDDLGLQLKLLDALEDANDLPGARDLARGLRSKPNADASVRTAVGELYLRLAKKGGTPRDTEEGLRTFGEIVEFASDDPITRRRLGDLLRAHGYHEQASRQYETLEVMMPDDATIPLLRAAASQGLGKVEEAVRWAEKAAGANAPDASSGSAKTSRSLALTYLAWARDDARKNGKKDILLRLLTRTKSLMAADRQAPGVRVSLIWDHPDFHAVLWTDALGAMMPASTGDPLLGVAQAILPSGRDAKIDVRFEKEEARVAARFGLEATLTAVFDEGTDKERIVVQKVRVANEDDTDLRFVMRDGTMTPEAGR